MAKKKSGKSSFIVGSKVREFVKGKKCMVSGDLIEGLNVQVTALLSSAVDRAKSNKRKTVRGCDV